MQLKITAKYENPSREDTEFTRHCLEGTVIYFRPNPTFMVADSTFRML